MNQRPIKFRAWDVFYNKFIYSEEGEGSLSNFFAKVAGGESAGREVPVMQFTGLLDVHGKEIYEGDVVNADGKKALVEWNKSEPFYWVRFGENKFNYLWDVLDIEIIGNIYEHPNLLSV